VEALSNEKCHDFGPTYARDYLASKKKISVSKETTRRWMKEEKLWRPSKSKLEKKLHVWRQRRSRFGELVQWDTSDHDWLEGRGNQRLYLIAMIDDATSRLWVRFALRDSTQENMKLLETYLNQHGRPASFYTGKASLFVSTPKTARDQKHLPQDEREPLPPTQIERALRELGIVWIAAHSPQAKGRVERSFETAQDRLVKDLRMAEVDTLADTNRCLETEYIPWWNRTLAVEPAEPDDAHRSLEQGHDLEAILSHVEKRIVKPDYTFQCDAKWYVIEQADIRKGLRGTTIRIEKRRNGTMAVRFEDHYLRYKMCEVRPKVAPAMPSAESTSKAKRSPCPMRPANRSGRGSNAELKGCPIPGNVFDDRMRQGPDCNRCLMVCADHLSLGFLAAAIYVGVPTCVFKASRNLSVRCESLPGLDRSAASRQLLRPSPATRREVHVILIVQMSSGRLFLDRLLASIARLRFNGTMNLPCSFPRATLNRTFLLCLDRTRLTLVQL